MRNWLRNLNSLLSPTQQQVECVGKMVFISLGSFVSPTGLMLEHALGPYIDVKAFSHVETFLPTMLQLSNQMQASHGQIARAIIPEIFLALAVSVAFIFLCGRMGETFTRFAMRRWPEGFSWMAEQRLMERESP